MTEILTALLIFLPLLLVLWLANLADRWHPDRLNAAPVGDLGPAAARLDRENGGGLPALAEGEPETAAPATRPPEGERPAWESAAGQVGAGSPERAAAEWVGASEPLQPAPSRPAAYGHAMTPAAPAARQAPDDSGTVFAAIAYTVLILLYLGMFAGGLFVQVIGALAKGPAGAGVIAAWSQAGLNGQALAGQLPQLALSLWVPALCGLILLLRPVRRLFAHIIPIDPTRTVHAVALAFVPLIVVNLLTTTIFLPQLASGLQEQANQGLQPFTISFIWIQDLIFLLMGIVGVGWLARRSLGQALRRLDLRVPTLRQAAAGVGAGLAMIAVALGIQLLAGTLGIAQDTNVETLTRVLIGPFTKSVFGVITLGVAAALGEETIFRGALQPRFGLIFTALLFALTHNQYGFSLSTVLVLILALVLGVIRQRANTTTSMITHATFNSVQGLLALLSILK